MTYFLECTNKTRLTCLSVLSMSIPCPQGAAGFARQSPALPLLEISIFCLLRFLKVSAITRTPSYVRADVYWWKIKVTIKENAKLSSSTMISVGSLSNRGHLSNHDFSTVSKVSFISQHLGLFDNKTSPYSKGQRKDVDGGREVIGSSWISKEQGDSWVEFDWRTTNHTDNTVRFSWRNSEH